MELLAKSLADAIEKVADWYELPANALIAWSYAVSGWKSTIVYLPNWDRLAVSGRPELWLNHPEWLEDGPTCDDFFTYYPSRVNERLPERRYDFVAQSVLASAYGYFQLPYPVALRNGFTDAPEELTTIEAIYIAGIALRNAVDDAEALGRTGPEALAFGLMSVSTQVPSRSRVAAIDDAHRALYGGGLFE